MFEMIKKLGREEKGQGMAEYGLILALVALALVGGFTFLSGGIDGLVRKVGTEVNPPAAE